MLFRSLARVNAILRRIRPALVGEVLTVGDLSLDAVAHKVLRQGKVMALGPTEFRLLKHFMEHPGRVFSRGQLLDAVWGHDRAVTDRTVDVYILRLRQKVESDPTNPVFIRSVRGFGYSFEQPQPEAATVTDADAVVK